MRYVVRRKKATTADDLLESPLIVVPTVYDHEPVETGILDADGDMLVRVTAPIGFVELVERD